MTEVIEDDPQSSCSAWRPDAAMPATPDWDGFYRFEPGSHMGGVGLLKVDAFRRRTRMIEVTGRFGFTEWQHEYRPSAGGSTPTSRGVARPCSVRAVGVARGAVRRAGLGAAVGAVPRAGRLLGMVAEMMGAPGAVTPPS